MCGIAGILNFKGGPIYRKDLEKLTNIISHRGPDSEGFWINESRNIGFGHRRLSIIDLSENAKQPMQYGNGRYTITYNGEIYNYIELREILLKNGYKFRSNSDTEVLLALFDWQGEKCLNFLDGMFAFAIWDEKEKQLFCARDRFGEKPFHYYYDQQKFVFGSEIKQIFAHGIRKQVSDVRVQRLISHGEIDDENDVTATFYENIKRLEPAHFIKLASNGKIEIACYWAIEPLDRSYTGTIEDAAEQFLHLLSKSVRLRLRSDVDVGSSLSGGIDSSSIVMLIDQLKGEKQEQNTFSARFKNFANDEGEHIEKVLKACRHVKANSTWPDEDYFLKVFEKVNFHQDEPYGSTSVIAQYAVMEAALKAKITVLLDGQGADEYLGGYLPYYSLYLNQLFYNDRKLYNTELKSYNSHHIDFKFYRNETLRMLIGRYKNKLLNRDNPYSGDVLQKKLYSDTFGNGLQVLLRYADRNAMASSREVRLPFLSHELVEFVFTLQDSFKLHSGWTKYVLRRSMQNILPHEICWRKDKIGYASPQSKWLESESVKNEIVKSAKQLGINNIEQSYNKEIAERNWRILMASKFVL